MRFISLLLLLLSACSFQTNNPTIGPVPASVQEPPPFYCTRLVTVAPWGEKSPPVAASGLHTKEQCELANAIAQSELAKIQCVKDGWSVEYECVPRSTAYCFSAEPYTHCYGDFETCVARQVIMEDDDAGPRKYSACKVSRGALSRHL